MVDDGKNGGQQLQPKVYVKAHLLTATLNDGIGYFLNKHNRKMVTKWLSSGGDDQNQPCMVVLGGSLKRFSWLSTQNGFQRPPYTKTV